MEQYQWCLFKDRPGLGVHFQQRVAKARLRQETSLRLQRKTDRRTSCTQSSETGKCQIILVWLKYSDSSQVLKEPPVLTDLSKKILGWFVCSDTLLMSCEVRSDKELWRHRAPHEEGRTSHNSQGNLPWQKEDCWQSSFRLLRWLLGRKIKIQSIYIIYLRRFKRVKLKMLYTVIWLNKRKEKYLITINIQSIYINVLH